MGVNEEDVVNIMGGMEHAGGIKLNDHKRKLKNRWVATKSGTCKDVDVLNACVILL